MIELDERRIAAFLLQHVGEYATSYLLVKEAGAYFGNMEKLTDNQLFELEDAVSKVADKYGFVLNKQHHDGKLEGLPWNLDFLIERKSDGGIDG